MLPKPLLVIASALLSALLSGTAAALGLGGMRTQSALNQPFYAEIELYGVEPDEIDAVKARLASRADFGKAGAERPHFLTRLQFSAAIGTDGRPYIQVSSREPIREPYIDFLVEVLWPEGRLVKEYTVLLDPPARGAAAQPRVVAPRVGVPRRRPPPEPEPAPPLRASASRPQQSPPRQAPQQTQATLPRPAPAPVPPQARGTRFPLYYGPVGRGATLTRIARELTPPGATVEQTSMALFRNNQDAFIRGNINMLRVGVDLVVPTAEELFALDQAAARRQFQDALAGRSVDTRPITDVSGDARLRIAGGAPGGQDEPSAVPAADPSFRDDLLMVQETTESNRQETTELRDRISELEQQLADIQRLLQLRNEQLAQLQRAVRAGDASVARDALPVPAPPGTASPATPVPATGATAEVLLPPVDDLAAAGAGPGSVATDRAPAAPVVEPGIGVVGPDGTVEQLVPPPVVAEASSGAAKPAAMDPASEPAAGPSRADIPADATTGGDQQPFWAVALSAVRGAARATPLWALAAAAGTVGLGGLALLAHRRRRRRALATDAPTAAAALVPQAAEPISDGAPVPGFEVSSTSAGRLELDTLPDLDSETPLHSVGTSDDDGPAIDVETGLPLNVVSNIPPSQQETQDADVLAEADIYILYGRYREAEALLREELERAPQRADLKYKLGEALIGSGNRSALAALLDEMRAAADDTADPAKWASLENGLAGLAADAVDGEEPAAPPPRIKPLDGVPVSVGSEQAWSGGFASTNDVIGETGDTDLGFSVREVTPSSAERLREQMADLELDLQEMDAFDGGLDSTQGSEGASTPPVPADDLADIGQSAAPLHIDPPALPSPAPLASPKKADAPPDDRLDLDLDGLEELTASPVDPVPPDLTLPVPEAAPDTAEPPAQRGTATRDTRTPLRDPLATTTLVRAPDAADESAAGGGPLEDSISSDVLSSQWRMDSGLWDEAATKMDLARAYLEMEDPDAARAILAEVVQEGSEEQRADAAAILAKIG